MLPCALPCWQGFLCATQSGSRSLTTDPRQAQVWQHLVIDVKRDLVCKLPVCYAVPRQIRLLTQNLLHEDCRELCADHVGPRSEPDREPVLPRVRCAANTRDPVGSGIFATRLPADIFLMSSVEGSSGSTAPSPSSSGSGGTVGSAAAPCGVSALREDSFPALATVADLPSHPVHVAPQSPSSPSSPNTLSVLAALSGVMFAGSPSRCIHFCWFLAPAEVCVHHRPAGGFCVQWQSRAFPRSFGTS